MIRTTACPDRPRLAAYLRGPARAADGQYLVTHLDHCPGCQRELELLAAGGEGLLRTARDVGRDPAGPDPALDGVLGRLADDGPPTRPGPDRGEDTADHFPYLDPPAAPGQVGRVGHYAVLGLVGRGGMGVVFRAFDEKLHREVALKVLSPRLAASPAARERFVREARAVAAVQGDHVVAIHAVEEAAGHPYLVMEYVAGESLQARLARGPLPLPDLVRVGAETALGLAAAHARGVIHRDIKPANVLVGPGGRVKITDFGLACAAGEADPARGGVVAGTPAYMAPEQARGEAVDHRADLFGLGSLLYALATGRPPVEGDTVLVVRRARAGRPGLTGAAGSLMPPWLAAIIDRLCAADPADRYGSAAEVAEVLRRRLRRLAKARPVRAGRGMVAALVLAAAGLGGWAAWRPGAHNPEPGGPGVISTDPPGARPLPQRVLLVLPARDFYFPECAAVHRELTGHGIEVVVTSSAPEEVVASEHSPGVWLPVGVPLRDARAADFGAVCFGGGTGVLEYAEGGAHAAEARRLIAETLESGRILAALGTGPVVLAEAGVLKGPATCYRYDPPKNEVPGRYIRRLRAAGATWVDRPAVATGSVITGQGGDRAPEFARVLVEQLTAARTE